MFRRPCGNSISFNPDLANTFPPIFLSPDGKFIFSSLTHDMNAFCSISLTLSGIFIFSSPEHLKNAPAPIFSKPDGKTISFTAFVSRNANKPISVIFCGTITFSSPLSRYLTNFRPEILKPIPYLSVYEFREYKLVAFHKLNVFKPYEYKGISPFDRIENFIFFKLYETCCLSDILFRNIHYFK